MITPQLRPSLALVGLALACRAPEPREVAPEGLVSAALAFSLTEAYGARLAYERHEASLWVSPRADDRELHDALAPLAHLALTPERGSDELRPLVDTLVEQVERAAREPASDAQREELHEVLLEWDGESLRVLVMPHGNLYERVAPGVSCRSVPVHDDAWLAGDGTPSPHGAVQASAKLLGGGELGLLDARALIERGVVEARHGRVTAETRADDPEAYGATQVLYEAVGGMLLPTVVREEFPDEFWQVMLVEYDVADGRAPSRAPFPRSALLLTAPCSPIGDGADLELERVTYRLLPAPHGRDALRMPVSAASSLRWNPGALEAHELDGFDPADAETWPARLLEVIELVPVADPKRSEPLGTGVAEDAGPSGS